jgi:hypothetical protein
MSRTEKAVHTFACDGADCEEVAENNTGELPDGWMSHLGQEWCNDCVLKAEGLLQSIKEAGVRAIMAKLLEPEFTYKYYSTPEEMVDTETNEEKSSDGFTRLQA